MPMQVPPVVETVRRVKVSIGDEWHEINFGKPIPRDAAIQRAREILEAFA